MIGLISELQRSDAISLDRFLHLPVSPSSAFLINYLGSSVSLSLILMLPAMAGLSAGLVLSRGATMLWLFPLVAAFFLLMTAVTYQFRGWLASMMQNPRRRRAIVAVIPVLFFLSFQLPNIWINLSPGARQQREARAEARRERARLDKDLADGRITREEYAETPSAAAGPELGRGLRDGAAGQSDRATGLAGVWRRSRDGRARVAPDCRSARDGPHWRPQPETGLRDDTPFVQRRFR